MHAFESEISVLRRHTCPGGAIPAQEEGGRRTEEEKESFYKSDMLPVETD